MRLRTNSLTPVLAALLIFALTTTMAAAGEINIGAKKFPVVNLPSSSPLITLRVVVRAGSAYDPAGKEGLAALTAALINEGGNKALSYREIVQKLYPMAASAQVQTDKEAVTFIGEVHKDHLDNFYRIFADNILKPRFDAGEFERVRTNAVNFLEKSLRGN